MAPQAGFEPATLRLTAGCSAVELLRNVVMQANGYLTEPPRERSIVLLVDNMRVAQRRRLHNCPVGNSVQRLLSPLGSIPAHRVQEILERGVEIPRCRLGVRMAEY